MEVYCTEPSLSISVPRLKLSYFATTVYFGHECAMVFGPGANVIKLFLSVIYKFFLVS
jgi:hypothetical protein